MSRKALILPLDSYQGVLKLEAPRNDARLLEKTLGLLGYRPDDISTNYSSNEASLSTYTLRRLIRHFFKAASPEDELLLYISAHGVDYDGTRYVVPIDYDTDDPPSPTELLSDHWLYGTARSSAATSVLIVLDSCRESVSLKFETAPKNVAHRPVAFDTATHLTSPTIAIMYSSHPGHLSWAAKGPNGYSFFTEALCEVLQSDDTIATLGALIPAVTSRLIEILPPGRQQAPFLDERYQASGRSGPPLALVVKEDRAARLRQRFAISPWCKILRSAPHWQSVSHGPIGLQLQLLLLALRSEEWATKADSALGGNRWRTDAALARLLNSITLIVDPDITTAPEAALCLAAAFVYEGILASLVLRLLEVGGIFDPPTDFIAHGAAGLVTRAWRQFLDSDDDWVRRREHLIKAGAETAHTDVVIWQLWSFAHGAGELWSFTEQTAGATGWLNDRLQELMSPAPFKEVLDDGRVMELLQPRRLTRLTRLLFAEPEDIDAELIKTPGGLQRQLTLGAGSDLWVIDEALIAHILSLSGALALDARRLPEVVIEHFGLDDGFDVNIVQRDLERARWQRFDTRLILALETAYPALHAGLGKIVNDLEHHRRRLATSTFARHIIDKIPLSFSDSRLQPSTGVDYRPLFDPEHLRFTLDQQRIFRLLMGEALYAKPSRALRELYQNSLDACRYRRARETFISKQHAEQSTYQGHIAFRAGFHRGRPFISCEDNGIGMGEQHLRNLFARAGRRFTDSHEFHLDRAQWEEHGVTFFPNSRFGIGVLSYFMLAEELALETRRIESHGGPAATGLSVRVTGAGSLFRITHDPSIRPHGGSCLTLFLKDIASDVDSLLATILEWLSLPEVHTTLHWADGRMESLSPGKPSDTYINRIGELIPVPATSSTLGQIRGFWAPETWLQPRRNDGSRVIEDILVDGVRSTASPPLSGILLNVTEELTEKIAGNISVDRERVVVSDALQAWVDSHFAIDGLQALLDWKGGRSTTLVALATAQPVLIVLLDARLRSCDLTLHSTHLVDFVSESCAPPNGLGLSIADRTISHILRGRVVESGTPDTFIAIRMIEMVDAGLDLPLAFKRYAYFVRDTLPVDRLALGSQLFWPDDPLSIFPINSEFGVSKYLTIEPEKRISMAALMRVSNQLRIGMASAIDLARPLSELGLLSLDLDSIIGSVETLDDSTGRLLFRSLQPNRSYCDRIELPQLLNCVVTSGRSVAQVVALAEPLVAIGLVDVDLRGFEKLSDISLAAITILRDAAKLPWTDNLLVQTLSLIRARKVLPDLIREIDRALHFIGHAGATKLELLAGLPDDALYLLSRDFDGMAPFVSAITNGHILTAVRRMMVPIERVLEMARLLLPHGLVSADLDALEQLGAVLPEWIDLFSNEAEGYEGDFDYAPLATIGAGQLIRYGRARSLSAQQLSEITRPLARAGLVEIDIGLFASLDSLLDDDVLRVLSRNLDGNSPYFEKVSVEHFRKAAIVLNLTQEQLTRVSERIYTFELGVGERSDIAVTSQSRSLLRRILSRDFDDAPPWRTYLTGLDLAVAEHLMGLSIVELRPYLTDLASCGVDVTSALRYADSYLDGAVE